MSERYKRQRLHFPFTWEKCVVVLGCVEGEVNTELFGQAGPRGSVGVVVGGCRASTELFLSQRRLSCHARVCSSTPLGADLHPCVGTLWLQPHFSAFPINRGRKHLSFQLLKQSIQDHQHFLLCPCSSCVNADWRKPPVCALPCLLSIAELWGTGSSSADTARQVCSEISDSFGKTPHILLSSCFLTCFPFF